MSAPSTALPATAPAQDGIEVEFLGEFALRVGGTDVHGWRAGRSRALAQYLLVNHNQVLSRERLEEAVWPERLDGPSASSLKVAAHGVRRSLADAADDTATLEWRGGGYVLRCGTIASDVDALREDCDEGTAAAREGQDDDAERLLDRAVSRYRGEFLAGEYAPWVLQRREWVRSKALSALRALRALAARHDDDEQVEHWCHRALDIDPYQEHVYRELADLHAAHGEHARARSWEQLCHQRLAEIGVTPTV